MKKRKDPHKFAIYRSRVTDVITGRLLAPFGATPNVRLAVKPLYMSVLVLVNGFEGSFELFPHDESPNKVL